MWRRNNEILRSCVFQENYLKFKTFKKKQSSHLKKHLTEAAYYDYRARCTYSAEAARQSSSGYDQNLDVVHTYNSYILQLLYQHISKIPSIIPYN